MDISEVRFDNAQRHPWELSRRASLLRVLDCRDPDAQYIDVGSGDLYFARALGALSRRPVIAVDPQFPAADLELADGIRRFRRIGEVPAASGDCVVGMDVLEHVPDDTALLAAMAGIAKPGGEILITVPAFPFLFSAHDVCLKHVRRYDKRGLLRLLRGCGLQPVEVFFFYASLFGARLLDKAVRTVLPAGARGAGHWRFPATHPITRAARGLLDADFAIGRSAAALGLSLPGLSLCARCLKPSV
jgi:SAM-dependent methyltransferase